MKIILCTFLLCITAVSVFGQSVELNGILGESVKFPAAVEKGGFLMYRGVRIGEVDSGSFRASLNENYRDRLQWDSSTGLFSLSGLKMEDIGEYKVQNADPNIITVFQLNVHIPVSKPHLNVTHNEYRCTILCATVRGTGVTLTLYREGEKKPYVTSPVRSHPLDMTKTVENGTYTCEARNSVSRETSDPLTVGAHCTVSVFGILGESVKFPAAVKKKGSLMHSSGTIGDVTEGSFTALRNEKYRDRLHWDSSTGLFSLSGLREEDSGEYKVQNTDQNIITIFQLNVHIPVSKPHVSVTRDEYPCSLLCSVEKGTGVTLSWYREGEKKPYGSSTVRSGLDLPQTVDKSGIYTCEANNSVSRETSDPLTVGAHCKVTAPSGSNTWQIVAGVFIFLAAVFFVTLIYFLRCHNRRKDAIIDGIERNIRDNFVYRPEAPEKMTSSHQTEVPLNQASREVGEL